MARCRWPPETAKADDVRKFTAVAPNNPLAGAPTAGLRSYCMPSCGATYTLRYSLTCAYASNHILRRAA